MRISQHRIPWRPKGREKSEKWQKEKPSVLCPVSQQPIHGRSAIQTSCYGRPPPHTHRNWDIFQSFPTAPQDVLVRPWCPCTLCRGEVIIYTQTWSLHWTSGLIDSAKEKGPICPLIRWTEIFIPGTRHGRKFSFNSKSQTPSPFVIAFSNDVPPVTLWTLQQKIVQGILPLGSCFQIGSFISLLWCQCLINVSSNSTDYYGKAFLGLCPGPYFQGS